MKSYFLELLAAKSLAEGRRLSVRTAWKESGVSKRVAYGMANGTLKEYPDTALIALCHYFDCEIGDLLKVEDDEADAVSNAVSL